MAILNWLLLRGDVPKRFASQTVVSIGNFAVSILAARALGPGQFGAFALIWTIVVFALSGQWALIISPMQNSLAHPPDGNGSELFGALVAHSILLALLTSAVAATVFIVTTRGLAGPFESSLVALGAGCVVAQDFARRWLLATNRPARALASDAIRQGGSLTALLLLPYFRTIDLADCMLIIGGAATIGTAPLARDISRARMSFSTFSRWATRHSRSGRWLLPSVVLQSINSAAPLYMLGAALGTHAVGGYRAAVAVASPIVILTEALETFLPLRSREAFLVGGRLGLRSVLSHRLAPLLPLCIGYLVLLCCFRRYVLEFTFGPKYADYSLALAIVGIAAFIQFLVYVCNVALRALDRSRSVFAGDLTSTIALIVMLIFVLRAPSAVAVAICVALHQAIKLLVLLSLLRKEFYA